MSRTTLMRLLIIIALFPLAGCQIRFGNETHMPYNADAKAIAPPDQPPSRVVEVPGDVPGVRFSTWQETGVSLRDGDVLYIQAEGFVNYYGANSKVTPNGRKRKFAHSLVPDVAFVSLVGRTHYGLLDDGIDASGKGLYGPGFVGSQFKMVFRNPAPRLLNPKRELFLAVNDSMDDDNSGSFTVRIWVVRNNKVVY